MFHWIDGKVNNISKAAWFAQVPFSVLSILAIILLISGTISPLYLIVTFVMWVLISGLGIAVGYHRVFSHKTHTLPLWKENLLLFFGALAGQGGAIFWVAVHRGSHHPHADTENDLHSPVIHGNWHAFAGWSADVTQNNAMNKIKIKSAVDLIRRRNHVWFNKHVYKILWGVPLVVALFNWQLALVGFCLASGMAILQDNLVNVVGHKKAWFGYRRFATKDNSYNHPLLGLLTWGQSLHNNHHHDPKSYSFAKGKLEWDPCVIFLPFLK